MAIFYTVDRSGKLKEGMELNTQRHGDILPAELQQHVDFMFPNGVSKHGDSYFLSSGSKANIASPAIEILFEYARRAHFQDKPSRFTSLFGVDSLLSATDFNTRYAEGKAGIWEVDADVYFRGNMNLLTSNQTTLVYSYFAHLYWKGETGPIPPFWEYLLTPPVRVLRRVVPEISGMESLGIPAFGTSPNNAPNRTQTEQSI